MMKRNNVACLRVCRRPQFYDKVPHFELIDRAQKSRQSKNRIVGKVPISRAHPFAAVSTAL
jgi:hypothetical protein